MADEILWAVNTFLVDPYILHTPKDEVSPHDGQCRWSESYGLARQFAVMWTWIYIGSLIIYFSMSCVTYWQYYSEIEEKVLLKQHYQAIKDVTENPDTNTTKSKKDKALRIDTNPAHWQKDYSQVWFEIFTSCWSLAIMSAMVAPLEIAVMCNYGQVYYHVTDYGWTYLLVSPLLFLLFTDSTIYWIHRALHHPRLYYLHKLHHKYKETTPFSAFAFHPLDGFAQGVPYHIFVFALPMHSYLYAFTLLIVGMWTVNIHDRVTFRIPNVNGAAHHTIHHTKFNYNYGQYFTFWDRWCGTYKDPYEMWPYNEVEDGVAQELFEAALGLQHTEQQLSKPKTVSPYSSDSDSEHINKPKVA